MADLRMAQKAGKLNHSQELLKPKQQMKQALEVLLKEEMH